MGESSDLKRIGSAGAGQTRTFWDVKVTVAIPFSRWGAEPFIVDPIPFPERVLLEIKTRRCEKSRKKDGAMHPFDLALKWEKELVTERGLSKARIAARAGLSRARVTQIMNLLWLPEPIQKVLHDPPKPLTIQSFNERRLRKLLSLKTADLQLRNWRTWIAELEKCHSSGPS